MNLTLGRSGRQAPPQQAQASSLGPGGFRVTRPSRSSTRGDARSTVQKLPKIFGAGPAASVHDVFAGITPSSWQPDESRLLDTQLRHEVHDLTMLCGSMQMTQPGRDRVHRPTRRAWLEMMMVQTPKLVSTLDQLLEQEELSHLRLELRSKKAPITSMPSSENSGTKDGIFVDRYHSVDEESPDLPRNSSNGSSCVVARRSNDPRSPAGESISKDDARSFPSSPISEQTLHERAKQRKSTRLSKASPATQPSQIQTASHWGNVRSSFSNQRVLRSGAASFGADHALRPLVEVLVPDPGKRGMSAQQFRNFFAKYCGDILGAEINEADSSDGRPICLPLQLAERCVKENLKNAGSEGYRESQTNLYSVNNFFIKKHTTGPNEQSDACISYAEMLNPNGLPIEYFMSHHWGEDFGELIQGILRHAMVSAVMLGKRWQELAYWCCAFANNQHSVELGDTLEKSPFYLALSSEGCRGAIMNLNQVASALQRTWCIYETHLTHVQGKSFTINTPQGPLVDVCESSPEKDMWVKHIFRLLQHINVANASATNQEDHRKIMGEVANFEKDGRKGAPALDISVRAILANEALSTLARSGEEGLVKQAIDLKAELGRRDRHEVLPLTYAAGAKHKRVVELLISKKADIRAQEGAEHVLQMWANRENVRQDAIEAVTKLCSSDAVLHKIHGPALHIARLNNASIRVAALSGALGSSEKNLRLEALYQIGKHLLVLCEGGASGAATAYMRREARALAGCLGDQHMDVQLAAVEAIGSLRKLTLGDFIVDHGEIRSDYLERDLNEEQGTNVVLEAACSAGAHALFGLIKGVETPFPRKALTKTDKRGRTVLHLAASHGHAVCIKALVDECSLKRDLLKQDDDDKRTVLHHAAASGDLQCFEMVFELGGFNKVQLDDEDAMDKTVLHIAAENGHWDLVLAFAKNPKYSLNATAFTKRDKSGWNVVHYIADRPDGAECLRGLYTQKWIPKKAMQVKDNYFRTPAHIAAMKDHDGFLRMLQELHGDVHLPAHDAQLTSGVKQVALVQHERALTKNLALHEAYSEGQQKFDEYWRVGRVIRIHRDGRFMFSYEDESEGAREQEYVDNDRVILRPTPMTMAQKFNCPKALKVLEAYWDIVREYLTEEELHKEAAMGSLPVGLLAASDNPDAVAKLIEFVKDGTLWCMDFSKQDGCGRNALHRAASTGRAYNVEVVLGVGAFGEGDFIIADDLGWNALHHAAKAGNAECMMMLLEKGHFESEQLRCKDKWHRTPLHIAAAADAHEVLELPVFTVKYHVTMGSAHPEEGNVALVRTSKEDPGQKRMSLTGPLRRSPTRMRTKQLTDADMVWQLGMVDRVSDDGTFTFHYESGGREALVAKDNCIFAPTPLMLAEALRCTAAAEVLLGHWEKMSELLQTPVDDFLKDLREGLLPSGILAKYGKPELVSTVSDAFSLEPVDFSEVDGYHRTALHWAVCSGSIDMLKVIADRGHFESESLEVVDIRGRNIIHLAAASGDEWCVTQVCLLIKTHEDEDSGNGENLRAMIGDHDNWGYTPLHLAAYSDKGSVIRVLLENGAPTNSVMRTADAEQPKAMSEGAIALFPWPSDDRKEWRISYFYVDKRGEKPIPTLVCENGERLPLEEDDVESFQAECIFGPTALDLATKFERMQAIDLLGRQPKVMDCPLGYNKIRKSVAKMAHMQSLVRSKAGEAVQNDDLDSTR